MQIGLTEADNISRVLLSLDVTEKVIIEAVERDCQLIVSHHPLLFKGVKRIADTTMVERCIRLAIKNDIALYAAHTNLDNTAEGVSNAMGRQLGLQNLNPLLPLPHKNAGEGAIGILPKPLTKEEFHQLVRTTFNVPHFLSNNASFEPIQRIALCGGSGAFLAQEAVRQKADAFITGEMGYHQFFDYEENIHLAIIGHYESEQCAITLLKKILNKSCPSLTLLTSNQNTNPIKHL